MTRLSPGGRLAVFTSYEIAPLHLRGCRSAFRGLKSSWAVRISRFRTVVSALCSFALIGHPLSRVGLQPFDNGGVSHAPRPPVLTPSVAGGASPYEKVSAVAGGASPSAKVGVRPSCPERAAGAVTQVPMMLQKALQLNDFRLAMGLSPRRR